MAAVYLADKGWGYIDKTGKVVIEPQFEMAGSFSEGLAGVEIDGKSGFIDKTGQIVIEPQYDVVSKFNEGVAVAVKGDEVLLIEKSGRVILSRDVNELDLSLDEEPRLSEGVIAAYDHAESQVGFINKSGEFIIEPVYGQAGPFSEGLARVLTYDAEGEEKVGFIDHSGRFVIAPGFNTDANFQRNSTDFSEGLAGLTEGFRPTITERGKFVFIDKKGSIVLSTNFAYAGPFRQGVALVYDAGTNKWGYIDKSGKVIIPVQYDLAGDFSEGLAYTAILNT